MPVFWHRATHFAGYESYVSSLTDLEVSVQGGQALLYAATGSGGGLSAFCLNGNTDALYLCSKTIISGLGHLAPPQVEIIPTDWGYFSLSVGMNISGVNAFKLDEAGRIGSRQSIDLQTTPLVQLKATTQITIDGRSFLFASTTDKLNPVVFETGLPGGLALASDASMTVESGFGALASVFSGGQAVLFGVNSATGMIRSYRIATNGTLQTACTLTSDSRIGFQAPSNVVTAEIGGKSFAIIGASGSSSLTVLEVNSDGTFNATDHIIDSLETRFQGVTALQSFTAGGRAYVLAGGGDDGISLFSLLPTGQLIHLTTFVDTAAMTLADVSALAVWVQDDVSAQVFVGSASETGISQLHLDLGAAGVSLQASGAMSTLAGGAGDDLLLGDATAIDLYGYGGEDLLVSGTGRARFWGGTGADTFVLTANGQINQIMDFKPGYDQIDLTRMPMLRSLSQLAINSTPDGAEIRYLDTTLQVMLASGTSLSVAQLLGSIRLSVSRYEPALDYEDLIGISFGDMTGIVKSGSAVADMYIGTVGFDLLQGNGGNDTLSGGGNNDTITGGSGNDLLTGGTLSFLSPELKVSNFGKEAGGWISQDLTPRLLVAGDQGISIIGFGTRGTYLSKSAGDFEFTNATFAVNNFGIAQGWISFDKYPRLVGDFNGDGRDDIIGFGIRGAYLADAVSSGGFGSAYYAIHNFGAQQGWSSFDKYPRVIGDINGDGRDDVIGFGARGTYVALAKVNGGFYEPRKYVNNFGIDQGWSSNEKYLRATGDLNGDGFADIVGFGFNGVYVALSDGHGNLGAATLMLSDFGVRQGWNASSTLQRMVMDLNNDGLDDIIAFGTDTTYIAISRGAGQFNTAQAFTSEGRDNWAGQSLEPRYLADMNDDGVIDIVTFSKNGVTVALGMPDNDTFVFDDGFGIDRILDFDALNPYEKIDFSNHSALDSYAKVQLAMTQVGNDVVINAGADVLTLEHVLLGALGADDFIF